MKIIEISEGDALDLCGREESHFFDRKAAAIKGNKVKKLQ